MTNTHVRDLLPSPPRWTRLGDPPRRLATGGRASSASVYGRVAAGARLASRMVRVPAQAEEVLPTDACDSAVRRGSTPRAEVRPFGGLGDCRIGNQPWIRLPSAAVLARVSHIQSSGKLVTRGFVGVAEP
jgi:hypothetical protein